MSIAAAPPPRASDATAETPLERYVRLVELVAAFPGRLTLADAAALSDLPKTTAHRLLKALVKVELATGGEGGRPYAPGSRLTRLVHAAAQDGWLDALARPLLAECARASGEACHLSRLVGARVRVAVSQAPQARWRSPVRAGLDMPPHAAASAKAILAFQEEDVIARALAAERPKLTAKTRTDEAWIRAEYARVRRRGYAACRGEIDDGLAALAVPVRQPDGQTLHAVAMTGPPARIMGARRAAHLAALKTVSEALAARLSLGLTLSRR